MPSGGHRQVLLRAALLKLRALHQVKHCKKNKQQDHTRGLNRVFVDMYLQNKDLWLSHEALAFVSFEQGRDILNADLAIEGVNVIVLAVAQEHEHKAVHI